MALHMARIHLDAHICTTPSDLYQKGVARVTQLQAMDIFGIAYSRALCGNMESRIPVVLPSDDDLHRGYSVIVFVLKMIENILVQLLTDRCQIAAVIRRCNQCDALGMDQSLVLHTCWALLREFGLWTPPSTLSNKTAAAARALDCHTANCIWSCIGMHYGAPPQQCR
ncbi:hypothetical protein M431DRAFT_499618 [Trichoderma harzianum CBS 226.95]|uniref:Uncharacterized protein n=1 Tax=Trichoderma harzianum CBS 226.95 TaxID=983964 RepID=A0A2T3ZZE3_TRIHA|nr:hypothetical protein M431DRAFT_499618 [Trichoderma harzianum CBS 226.95]PTB50169.1 hypothetical protein M431DRAFT_499618 [Trichoderma harzianum CBS 226.95]